MTDDGGTAQDPGCATMSPGTRRTTIRPPPCPPGCGRCRRSPTYLEGTAPAAVQVISVCAGEGRDILGVLAQRDDRERVTGALVEIDEAICAVADAEIVALGCAGRIIVRRADAGLLSAYEGLRPADLLLLSGIMGNITADDIRRLIHVARTLCAPGATVLWTRGARSPTWGRPSGRGSTERDSRGCR